MNGSARRELNRVPDGKSDRERLITIEEAASILELDEGDVRSFVAEGKIPAYRIGGEFIRLRKGQVEALKSRLKVLKHQSVPIYHLSPPSEPQSRQRYSLFDKVRDFVYLNDFYILVFILIVLLTVFIITRK
jgi:excisionase family DNA binding protein